MRSQENRKSLPVWILAVVGFASLAVLAACGGGSSTTPPPPVVTVTVSPSKPALTSGQSQQFTATVTGTTNTAVTWTASGGTISTTGLFTDTVTAATTVTVTATSSADSTAKGTATVTVNPIVPIVVTVNPSTTTLSSGQSQQFTATVTGSTNTAVTWMASGGTISSSGLFSDAVATASTVTVTATSSADSTKKGSATVVVNPIMVTVSPIAVTLVSGQTQQFTATVAGSSNSAVLWTASSGVISSTGVFSDATTTATTVTVTATSSADLITKGTATVTVNPNTAGDITQIQHIVFIIKENHSFDNYFGTFPGAEGATTGVTSTGATVPLTRGADRPPYDIGHGFTDTVTAIDGGKMDKFDLIHFGNVNGFLLPYTQYLQADIPNYWTLAQNYVLADHMFSSLTGPSFPNHLYTIAADSVGVTDNPINTTTDPTHTETVKWGCDAAPMATVKVIDANGNSLTPVFPCFDPTTIVDRMQAAPTPITWKYYGPREGQSGYIWNTLDAIKHIRYAADGVTDGPLWISNDVIDSEFDTDALNGNLPEVSYLVTSGMDSEHPVSSVCGGENRTIAQIDAVMNGPDWSSTAIFVVWDDHGGFYDHLAPTKKDAWGLGVRVPLLIISPFAKQGLVSKTPYEFGSFLAFVEKRFNLAPLTARDANANDMEDAFDFTQIARVPTPLPQRICP